MGYQDAVPGVAGELVRDRPRQDQVGARRQRCHEGPELVARSPEARARVHVGEDSFDLSRDDVRGLQRENGVADKSNGPLAKDRRRMAGPVAAARVQPPRRVLGEQLAQPKNLCHVLAPRFPQLVERNQTFVQLANRVAASSGAPPRKALFDDP